MRLVGVSRRFGALRAVDEVTLDVAAGELFAMLGPSGSGKTTCLRLIAGFERPDEGRIEIDGVEMGALPPYRRPVNTVFQDYALFPHLNVAQNVGYGPMVRGLGRRERAALVEEALALVRLEGYGSRRPTLLSGGQRQRVALARALVNRPRVLLLDEPLGALDLKLREAMQAELRSLQRRLGITFVLVTHDQGEALSMADRVAVFRSGQIVQLGTPEEVYERPATPFVADFVGGANVIDGDLARRLGAHAPSSLRPERIALLTLEDPLQADTVRVEGVCIDRQYHGASQRVLVDTGTGALTVQTADPRWRSLGPGAPIRLAWPRSAMHPMQPDP